MLMEIKEDFEKEFFTDPLVQFCELLREREIIFGRLQKECC